MTDEAKRDRIAALRSHADAAMAELLETRSALDAERTRAAELSRLSATLTAEVAQQVRAGVELRHQLLRAREDEQRRIGRDLHDQMGQTVTLLRFAVLSVRNAGHHSEAALARLAEVDRLAQQLGREIGELTCRLRPLVLDELGLLPALKQLVDDWSACTGVRVELGSAGIVGRLPFEVETTLYRVVQEALTNVARHARAQHVIVVVQREGSHAIARIEDDGVGFDPAAAASGRSGILGMRERLSLVSGSLEIESGAHCGATLIARVPLTPFLEGA